MAFEKIKRAGRWAKDTADGVIDKGDELARRAGRATVDLGRRAGRASMDKARELKAARDVRLTNPDVQANILEAKNKMKDSWKKAGKQTLDSVWKGIFVNTFRAVGGTFNTFNPMLWPAKGTLQAAKWGGVFMLEGGKLIRDVLIAGGKTSAYLARRLGGF